MFEKELTLIKQVNQKNVCFVVIGTWYFKYAGFRFEPHVFNKCNDVLMTAYELKHIAILKVKGVDFRCILWGNSVLEDRLSYKSSLNGK